MRTAVEMAAALVGGKDALRQRPVLSIMQCTYSPLGHDGGSLEAGLVAAEAGLPVGYMTMASAGSNGPVTLAGDLVVGNAEVITALALMQMARPGLPGVLCRCPDSDRPAHRRLHRRRAGGLPVWCCDQRAC